MASLLLVLTAVVGLLLTTPCGGARTANNYLRTGETLGTDEELTYGNNHFIMQDDCNLVLYNGAQGWQSNTANRGRDCKLTLNNVGQLVIKDSSGNTIFTTTPKSKEGKYVAVLHPDGKVVVYGPVAWSNRPMTTVDFNGRNFLGNTPLVKNLLLSGQTLYEDEKLETRNYRLVMQGDCNLVLYGGNWQSNTANNGRYCFLRLDHKGELSIRDDDHRKVWSSGSASVEGDYVLILQENGIAAIFGPAIFSTKSKTNMAGNIAMLAQQ